MKDYFIDVPRMERIEKNVRVREMFVWIPGLTFLLPSRETLRQYLLRLSMLTRSLNKIIIHSLRVNCFWISCPANLVARFSFFWVSILEHNYQTISCGITESTLKIALFEFCHRFCFVFCFFWQSNFPKAQVQTRHVIEYFLK